jgi:cytochrome c oxidase subunit IV
VAGYRFEGLLGSSLIGIILFHRHGILLRGVLRRLAWERIELDRNLSAVLKNHSTIF